MLASLRALTRQKVGWPVTRGRRPSLPLALVFAPCANLRTLPYPVSAWAIALGHGSDSAGPVPASDPTPSPQPCRSPPRSTGPQPSTPTAAASVLLLSRLSHGLLREPASAAAVPADWHSPPHALPHAPRGSPALSTTSDLGDESPGVPEGGPAGIETSGG